MKKYLFLACVILTLLCGALTWGLSNLHKENKRLENNQSALIGKIEFYQTEAGKSAASVQRLELTKSELEAYNAELVNTIGDLNIKLKRVQEATTTATETKVEVVTVVRDSIVYANSGEPERLQTIRWRDPWVRVDGTIKNDSTVNLSIQSIDTLYQVVHRVPKRFLFIKYGTKAIRQDITSSNPHTKIVYTEYIELARRRKK